MPQAFGLVFLGTTSSITLLGVSLTTAAGALTIAGTVLNAAILTAISGGFNKGPSAPRPEDVKRVFRQEVGPRYVHCGQVLTGGQVVFRRSKEGFYHQVTVHGHDGPYDVREVRLDNTAMTIVSGVVQNAKYDVGGRKRVAIETRAGIVPETAYSGLTSAYSDWDEDHRLDGQCSTYLKREQVSASEYNTTYPNDPPAISVVLRARPIYDPRTETTAYTENAALIIADYIETAMGKPTNQAALITAANICDEAVPLLAGGTEPRWRLNMTYSIAEEPQDVLARMLAACAGSVSFLDGEAVIRVGAAETPTITITKSDILEMLDSTNGPDLVDIYSELPFTYVDRSLDYIQVTGDPWVRDDIESDLGKTVVGATLNLDACATSTQARRAAKHKSYTDNPEETVTLRLKPRAMEIIGESVVTLDFSVFSGKFYVRNWSQNVETLETTVKLEKVDDAANAWSTSEEGAVQTRPAGDEDGVVPTMANFNGAGTGIQSSQTTFAASITVAWDAPASDALTPVVEYSKAGADEWTTLILTSGQTSASLGALNDGVLYDVRGHFVTPSGIAGANATEDDVQALAASTAPDAPTSLTVIDQHGGVGLVTVTASATAANWKTIVYRDAVKIFEQSSESSEPLSFSDSAGAGSYSYTAKAINVSNVASVLTAAVPVTIT